MLSALIAISNEIGRSDRLPFFQPWFDCDFRSRSNWLTDGDEEEGGEGSWRPLLMTVFSVVKLDAVSEALMTLTFGTLGVVGIGLFLIDELSKRLFLVPPKLRFRSICIRIGSGRLSSSKIGVDSPVFLLRVGTRKS